MAHQLPAHLHSAYAWINSAGEWDDALADPAGYARGAAANFADHAVASEWPGEVSASTLVDAIEWVSEHPGNERR